MVLFYVLATSLCGGLLAFFLLTICFNSGDHRS